MGCGSISSMSTAQPMGQNGGGGLASTTFSDFAKSAFSAQNEDASATTQGQQNAGQYAYDYAFASSDPNLNNANLNGSQFSNSWDNSLFNNSASNNVAYAYDFQSASSGF